VHDAASAEVRRPSTPGRPPSGQLRALTSHYKVFRPVSLLWC
jgi:hypothetical protein